MKEIPKGCRFWKQDADEVAPEEVVRMYGAGLAGAWRDDEALADLLDGQEYPELEAAAHHFGWADHAAGELVAPWLNVQRVFPGSLPGRAQQRGDCVSHSQRNAVLTACVGDIISGLVDEVTGRIEGPPEGVSAAGLLDGVFSTEAFYWYRRHGGDGWSCGAAAKVGQGEAGMVLRKNYPELGVDLSTYSGRNAGLYGRSTPPDAFQQVTRKNLVRNIARVTTFEGLRDALAQGCGITTCGSEGFSSTRDENGVSRRRGSWAHAMMVFGVDDRSITKEKYGEPLVGVGNSWGPSWNSGPKRVLGTEFSIFDGHFWTPWSDFRRREILALSGADGFAKRKLKYEPTPGWSTAT